MLEATERNLIAARNGQLEEGESPQSALYDTASTGLILLKRVRALSEACETALSCCQDGDATAAAHILHSALGDRA